MALRIRLPENPATTLVVALGATLGISLVNYAGGHTVGLSVFYLAPIFLVTWVLGRGWGFALALLGAWLDTVTDVSAGVEYAHPLLPIWDFGAKVGFYVAGAYLLSELRGALEREREAARTDPLTAMANRRAFFERAALELERALRYSRPFSVAVLDLDDFKHFNDRFGHGVGDAVLKTVSAAISLNTRSTDLVARLGGDEFALLLPETGAAAALALVEKLRGVLQSLRGYDEPISVSVGLVTYDAPPASVEDLVRRADVLMYRVKRSGKSQLKHEVVTW